MAKTTTLLLLLVMISFLSKAQSAYKVTGIVRDPQSKPMAGVTVSLLKATDSSISKFSLTNASGEFELDKLDAGTFLLKLTSVGMAPFTSERFELS